MRLKTQITITTLLVVLLPLAGLASIFPLSSEARVPVEPLARYARLKRVVSTLVEKNPEGALTIVPGREAPSWISLLIVDPQRRVAYSNMDGIAAGELLSLEAESDIFQGGEDASGLGNVFVGESIFVEGKPAGHYFALLHVSPAARRQPMWLTTFFTWFLLFLAFTGVGVSIVVGRLGSAVLSLEQAAAHIASGDLETSVQIKGPEEIASLGLAMERMRLALKEESERRVRFIASISHDLKTPLTSIEGYIEALQDELGGGNRTAAHYLGIMQDKSEILDRRIQDLIDFGRASTGDWQSHLEPRDLRDLLARMARNFSEDASLLGMNLSTDLDIPVGTRVPLDEPLFARALENIVSNSLRYCPRGSSILLKAALAERGVEIFVEDNGPGIAAVDLPLIFEPYYRGNHSGRDKGSGLGLYISKSIIQSHGWELAVESAEGRGARFIVTIPFTADEGKNSLNQGREGS